MTKQDWLKKSSIAVMLSTSLLMFAEGGQAFAADTTEVVASVDDSLNTAQIISLVREQIGKDYNKNSNGPTQFDAAGLVAYVYGKAGIHVEDTVAAIYRTGEKVSKSSLEPGDIVFFKNGTNTYPSYCGIYVGNDKFVYAAQGQDEVVEKKLSWFSNSYLGARRLHSVETPELPVTPPPTTTPAPTPTQPTPTNPGTINTQLGQKLIVTGEKYLAVPYKFGADWNDNQGKYFDCSGFTQRVFAENGIKLSRGARAQSQNGIKVSRKDLQVGDLVFFSTGATMKYDANSIKRIGHVGIYAGNNRVLHTYGKGGVRYSTMSKGWWDDHYVTATRVIK
ncbi:C40 family peptidase [Brevibacillus sp. SYSU BS000544]|uniref:C40 family peptidase n=1 Tax=Brevibacillus sp. SYSU BS000544 TaxID=3416443 RepID=UPI003CE508CF